MIRQPAIIITGGAGYIGSHVAYILAQQNYQVILLDSFLHNQRCNPSWAIIIKADYADRQILTTLFTSYDIKAVVHCAAFIEVGQSVMHPAQFYENNVAKTVTLLQSMIEHGIKKIIFSSTCAIYGNPQHLPLTEDHPKNPINPYGKTKLMIEMMLQDFQAAYGLEYVCLRYFNAAGALPEEGLGEQHTPESHLIPRALQAALEQSPFTAFGNDYETKDGTALRDYVHVLDIAQAHLLALQHLNAGKPSDCFNLGTGYGFSIKEIIEMVEKVCYTKIKLVYTQRRSGDAPILVADSLRAETILGWKREYSQLDFIIKSAYAFEQYRIHTLKEKIVEI
jgi:UDP-glucose 4-epimerase